MIVKTAVIAAAMSIGCAVGFAQSVRTAAAPVAAERPAGVRSAEDQKLFAEAVRLYRSGRWSAAYGRFVALADKGDVASSRIALQMLRHGGELYGTEWAAAPSQVVVWERAAAAGGPLKLAVLGE
jgi:hypothetical protein